MSSKLRMSFESHVVRRRQQGWTLALLALFWARSESAGLAPGTRLPSFRLANREKIRVPNALTGLQPQEGSRSVRSTTGARQPRPARYFRSCLRQRNKPSTRQMLKRQASQASYGIFVISYQASSEASHLWLYSVCLSSKKRRDVHDPPEYKHTTWKAL